MPNFKQQIIGNVILQRWTSQPAATDIEPMLSSLHAASQALAPRARLVGVAISPPSIALPTPAASRAMEGRYEELFRYAAELYVVVEPGSFRSARIITWVVNTVMLAQGREMRMARSVAAALADARTPLLVSAGEVIRRGRLAGIIVGTDAPP